MSSFEQELGVERDGSGGSYTLPLTPNPIIQLIPAPV